MSKRAGLVKIISEILLTCDFVLFLILEGKKVCSLISQSWGL